METKVYPGYTEYRYNDRLLITEQPTNLFKVWDLKAPRDFLHGGFKCVGRCTSLMAAEAVCRLENL